MTESCRELDLLGSFSRVSDTPRSVLEARDGFVEFHDFLSRSPAKPAFPLSGEFSLSIAPFIVPKESPNPSSSFGNESSMISEIRVSWGSKRKRKSPIRQTRVPKRPTEEEIAASGLLLLANQNPWKITKILTESDLNDLSRLLISKSQVQEHIIPHLDEQSRRKIHSREGLIVNVRDSDTDAVLQLKLKWWKSSKTYSFQSGWRRDFVRRRRLRKGDEIGLFWNRIESLFAFSVIRKARVGV